MRFVRRPRRLWRAPRIVDACIVFNELDLLELRLNELWDVVDQFVVVEAPFTFAGRAKPCFVADAAARFAPYASKLSVHRFDGEMPPTIPIGDYEGRLAVEVAQRNAIGAALLPLHLDRDDIVMVGDVDELPRAELVARLPKLSRWHQFCVFVLHNHRGYVNNRSRAALNGVRFSGTVATRYETVAEIGAHRVRCDEGRAPAVDAAHDARWHSAENAGWHLSSVGGPAAFWTKAANFAHIEDPFRVVRLTAAPVAIAVHDLALTREQCRAAQELYVQHCDDADFAPVTFDEFVVDVNLPRHVRMNKERYRGLFFFTDLISQSTVP